jgi:polyisoprenoid-binding protein YceI
MKQIIIFTFIFFSVASLPAQSYHPVDEGSSVKFIIKNFGMDTYGIFSGLEGNIVFNPGDLKGASFSASIDANTVNTEIEARDNMIREAAYLNVKAFPRISFVSKQIIRNNATGMFMMKGTISLKGIDKDISFPFKVINKEDGILLTAELKLNRLDFKIGLGSLVLSDNLTVILSVFAKKN